MTLVRDFDRSTKTTHSIKVTIIDAPVSRTGNYYYPEETYTPTEIHVDWVDGKTPEHITVVGPTSRKSECVKSYGPKQSPEWLRDVLLQMVDEASGWDLGRYAAS